MDIRPESDLGITIGDPIYTNPASEFMYTRAEEIDTRLKQAATHPSTVSEALLIRILRKNLRIIEYLSEIISKHPDWKTAPIDTLQNELKIQSMDEYAIRAIKDDSQMIEEVTQKMLILDSSQTQLAIIKNTAKSNETAYTYLVIYPPDSQTGERAREASYPTAMCHMIDAKALLTQSEPFTISGEKYDVSFNQIPSITDEELVKVVKRSGQTPLDKVIQAGLKIYDRIARRTGEHIDPISAITDKSYAIAYALATHRGVGLVDNERIILPSIK